MNPSQCIYCESANNLNTELTISLEDNTKVKVKICDAHAEDASVKSAKEAYLAKKSILDELLTKAKSLGLHISTSSSGIVSVESPKQTAPNSKPLPDPDFDTNAPDVVKTTMIDKNRMFKSVGGDSGGTHVSAHSSIDLNGLSDKLPDSVREGYAQLAVMEGRAGQPITIPHRRIDGTGVTRIIISKSENDDKLQNRFKKMAQDSMSDKMPDFAHSGYQETTRPCPICRGAGVVSQGKKQTNCPKCQGSGVISVY